MTLLLEHGATACVRDNTNRTPLQLALQAKFFDTAEVLARYDPDGPALLAEARRQFGSNGIDSNTSSESMGDAAHDTSVTRSQSQKLGANEDSVLDREPEPETAPREHTQDATSSGNSTSPAMNTAGGERIDAAGAAVSLGREPEPVFVEPSAASAARALRLAAACAAGDMEMVLAELCADDPPDLGALTGDGDTAVHLAIRAGHTAIFRTLVIHGASPFQRTSPRERTCLHTAAEAGDIATAVTLVREFGLRLSAADRDGMTPLHVAAERGHGKLAEALIWAQSASLEQLCAVLDATDANGASAIDVAVAAEHIECAAMLQRYRNICRVVDAGSSAQAVNAEYV